MIIKDKRISELIYKIRGCVFNVYNALGPYYVEKFYEHALMIELSDNGIEAKRQVEIPTYYKDRKLDLTLKADIIVNNEILIELKANSHPEPNKYYRQTLSYMRLTKTKYGMIINFGVEDLIKDNGIIPLAL